MLMSERVQAMEVERSAYIWLSIMIVLCSVHCQPSETAECESEVVVVAAVEQTVDGVTLSMASATADATLSTVIAEFGGFVVPQSECDSSRCPLVCMRESDSLFCPFPVQNGTQNFLAVVELEQSSAHGFQKKRQVLISPETDCVPLLVFDRGPGVSVRYIVPCLDTTSDQPFLYFEHLVLNFANLASSALMPDESISGQYVRTDGGNVSPLLYQDSDGGDTSCSPSRNVFIKVGSKVAVYRLFSHQAAVFQWSDPIRDCPGTKGFERFEPDLLRIKCTPTDNALYDVCGTQTVIERYDTTVNATVFQCSDADVNVFIFGGNLTIVPYGSSIEGDDVMDDVIMLPFNDTASAECVGRQSPMMFLSRSSGETYFVELLTGRVHYIAANTCSPYSCLDLIVLETRYGFIVGLFDYTNHTHLILNLSCPDSPIMSRMYYYEPPISSTLLLSTSTQPCPLCGTKPQPPRNPPEGMTQKPSDMSPDNSSEPPVTVDTPPNLAASDDKTWIGASIGGVTVLILAVVMVTLVIVLAVIFYRRHGCWHPQPLDNNQPADLGTATTCVSAEAEDQGLSRVMITPSSVSDKTRFTPGEVSTAFDERTEGEDNVNDFQQKMVTIQ